MIRTITTDIWRAEGISLEWVPENAAHSWAGTDAWILAGHEPVVRYQATRVGLIGFIRGVPHPLIRLSIDAAIDWFQRTSGVRHSTGGLLARSFGLDANGARTQIARTLGYAAAHELGHLLLASREHARGGLMRADITSLASLEGNSTTRALDGRSRDRLAERLARAAACR